MQNRGKSLYINLIELECALRCYNTALIEDQPITLKRPAVPIGHRYFKPANSSITIKWAWQTKTISIQYCLAHYVCNFKTKWIEMIAKNGNVYWCMSTLLFHRSTFFYFFIFKFLLLLTGYAIKTLWAMKQLHDLGRGPAGFRKAEGDAGHPSLPCWEWG